VVAEGDHGRVVIALARFRLALMAPVAAMIGRRARFRLRRRSRLGGLGPARFGLRLLTMLFAVTRLRLGVLLAMTLAPRLASLRLGVRLMAGAAASAPALAVAGFERELGDALDLDAGDLLADQPDDGVGILAVIGGREREGAALAAARPVRPMRCT
jgi:hypothetical protein